MRKGNNIRKTIGDIILVGTLLAAGCSGKGVAQNHIAVSQTPSQISEPLPSATSLSGNIEDTLGETKIYEPTPTRLVLPTPIPTATADPCGEEISFVTNAADYRVDKTPDGDPRTIVPQFITLHWDAQAGGPYDWNAEFTWRYFTSGETITSYPDPETGGHYNYTSQFVAGPDKVIQLLKTYQHCVQRSGCARGYPYDINIEMAGSFFKLDEDGIPNMQPSELNNTLELVISLMEQYPGIGLVGHFEHDIFLKDGVMYDASKPDPGIQFMEYFRNLVKQEIERRNLTPTPTSLP
jgi:hypothetical protein